MGLVVKEVTTLMATAKARAGANEKVIVHSAISAIQNRGRGLEFSWVGAYTATRWLRSK